MSNFLKNNQKTEVRARISYLLSRQVDELPVVAFILERYGRKAWNSYGRRKK